jgi:chromosome segregation ATPase
MADAEQAVWETLQGIYREEIPLAPDQILWSSRLEHERSVDRLRKALERVAARFDRQLVAYENGVLSLEDLRQAKARLEEERRVIQEELDAARLTLQDESAPVRELKAHIAALQALNRSALDGESQRAVLEAVLDHFTYSRRDDTLTLRFRL